MPGTATTKQEARTTTEAGVTILRRFTAYDFAVMWIEDRLPLSFQLRGRKPWGDLVADYLRDRYPWRLSDGSRNKNRLTLEACLREIRRSKVQLKKETLK